MTLNEYGITNYDVIIDKNYRNMQYVDWNASSLNFSFAIFSKPFYEMAGKTGLESFFYVISPTRP